MSKGSSSDDINIAYLEKLAQAVSDLSINLEKISPNYGANGQLEKTLIDIAKSVNNGDATLKQMLKTAANTQKDIRSVEYGIDSTAKYNKTVNMFIKLLEEKIKDSKLDDALVKKIATAFENLDVTAILESEKIGQKGGKGAPLKNVMDNEKLNKVNEDLARRIGLKLDESQSKLMAFFQEQEQKREKTTKGFVDDLIEGLEKSKWVGGALRDTFRLVGLLGGQWLSQFGQLGRILGGAFYVAMETAGPLLVNLLLKGMGNILGKFIGAGLGARVGWGLINALPMNGPLGNAITTFYGGGTAGQKLAAAGGLAGAGLVSAGLGAGALWAGGQSAQSFKQGDKVGGSAFGIGAAGLGVAAVAALVAGITAPVTLIAAAIGGIAVAVGGIWKNREAIMEHYKKHKEFYDKVLTFMDYLMPIFGVIRHAVMWWQDHFGGHTNVEDETGNKNSFGQKVANAFNIQDREKVQEIGGMGINRAGYATNLGKMSREQASDALKKYYEGHKEQATNAYDWMEVGEFYQHLYKNDAAIRDEKGNAILVPTYKGARKDLQDMNAALSSVGLSGMALSGSMQTASREGNTHVEGSLHDNIMGLVNDYAAGWTDDASWFKAFETLRPMMEERGFDLYYEGYDSQGKRRMTNNIADLQKPEFQGLTNKHFHVQRLKGMENLARTADPLKNIEASKARAQNQSIEITDIAKQLEPETYEFHSKHSTSKENMAAGIKSEMEGMGYYYNDEAQQWMKKAKKGFMGIGADSREGVIVRDPSGNLKFEKITTNMEGLVNGSSNGR